MQPSVKRQQALFDWWERVFDYTVLRSEAQAAPERPVWLLFHEAAERHPDDPVHLLRHMDMDLRHAALGLGYYLGYAVSSGDLEDERWAIRVWQAEKWIRHLLQAFSVEDIRDARPDLWASDDPNVVETGATGSGNEGLTRFVRDGCFEHGEPRRYEDLKRLNDGLRERARHALLAYLCGMNRVALPWGGVATSPEHLSELLLLDVEAGLDQRASRIEEAIGAVQIFIQRARLGLEPGFTPSPEFLLLLLLWDSRFVTAVLSPIAFGRPAGAGRSIGRAGSTGTSCRTQDKPNPSASSSRSYAAPH
ncbi:neuraminidase-like domain-containing protein [Candidatus Thiosymbion oneisti]|uniref:neuraminidase-like domain-containing protein n=1 Tax=Candidatus Thiosymbion oneisti TaxID=589554 RepID=UPI000AFE9009